MNDQLQKLVKAKIPHIVLSGDNADAIDSNMVRRIMEGEFRAVFMSPEIIFGDSPTSKLVQRLWHNTRWRALLLAVVVDEVHCVEKWGTFRPEYARLGELRIWSPGVPFVGVTATLTADALTQTMDTLFLSKANVVRVREVPTNVRLEVHTQSKDAMKGLSRLLGKGKTIVYFEKIPLLLDVFKYLSRERLDLRGKIGLYFSTLTPQLKEATMLKFAQGGLQVLLATEAVGMGCDNIPDVIQVVQFGFPRDMPSFVQRFGGAARDRKLQGFGVLYAPPITKTSPTDKNHHVEETWLLPDNVAKVLLQKFSQIRTTEAVAAFASSCYWTPLEGNITFREVAEVLGKINKEIDARRGSDSQMAASAIAQSEDGSDSDGEGSDSEEDLPESGELLAAAYATDQQPLGDQPLPTD
ncbi:ATP-dependent DNA helicase sgs1 [Gryganskiella cystojenkinii]|nr:ATP-dependent DNA helicase sgs1 [Gryganskiella cystojenkinii]